MKPTKRGICIDNELANYVYTLARAAHVSENQVYQRLLQIGRQDLAPFEGKALVAVIRDPWEAVQQLPALKRQLEKRSHGILAAPTATRLTVAENQAFRQFATRKKTTRSALQRDLVRRLLATEAA